MLPNTFIAFANFFNTILCFFYIKTAHQIRVLFLK